MWTNINIYLLGDIVINKQGLIFLTLTSLILVLSVYYVTMPTELLLKTNSMYNNEEEETTEVLIDNSSTIEKLSNIMLNNELDIKKFIEINADNNILKNIVDFIKYYEENHYNSIIYMNKIWNFYFKERNEYLNAFTIMILFYKDVLNYLLSKNVIIFVDYVEDIKQVANQNEKNKIIYKINVIINLREKIKFNVNNNLLMDKLIIQNL